MRSIRFARLDFEKKLSHFADDKEAIDRRKATLREVIDFDTPINDLLKGTQRAGKRQIGKWYFGDVNEEDNYIYGRLGVKKEEEGVEIDEDKKGFVNVSKEDTNISFFVIDLRSSVMAYEFRRDIGEKAPYRILEAVFNSYYDGRETVDIRPLVDKDEVREALKRFSRISKIKFSNLSPPNPDSTDRSRSMHEFLRESGINDLNLIGSNYSDEEEGIKYEGDPLLDGGLNLAEEGYGTATIEGKDEYGEEVVVSTDKKAIQDEADMTGEDKDDEERRDILIEKIRDVLDRLEQD